MKKRWISFLLAVCMLTALIPAGAVPAFAEDETPYQSQDERFYYTLDDSGNATIIACVETKDQLTTDGYAVTVPENITGKDGSTYPVTAIGEAAFSYYFSNNLYDKDACVGIKEINIEANLTSIGRVAFAYCEALKKITLPDTVQEMGDGVFSYCYVLEEIKFPSNMTEIPESTFGVCTSLSEITIPNSVKSIGEGAFDIFDEDSGEAITKLHITYKGTKEEWNELLKNTGEYNELLQTQTDNEKVTFDPEPEKPDPKPDPEPKPEPKPAPAPEEPAAEEEMAPNVLGAAGMIATAGVGAAAIGYAGYQVGTELYLIKLLPEGAAIPANAGELALLVWNDAGKPAPAALLPADAPETQQAMTWAVEQGLLSAEEKPEDAVSHTEVIRTWKKAQKRSD